MPPRALPSSSVRIVTGGPRLTSSRGADFGALPLRTHLFSAAMAALRTKCCGPELMGDLHSMIPGTAADGATISTTLDDVPRSVLPTTVWYESACAVPATSHS